MTQTPEGRQSRRAISKNIDHGATRPRSWCYLKRFGAPPHYFTVLVIAGKLGLTPGPDPIRSNHNKFKQIQSTE